MTPLEIRIPNRRDKMTTVVRMVEHFGVNYGINRAVINSLNVALDEVLNNIISYAYGPGEQSEILVRLIFQAGEIIVEIDDFGRPFNPLEAPSPDLSAPLRERKVGGLGVHFIKTLMDEVAYDRIGGRNQLRLTKKLATS